MKTIEELLDYLEEYELQENPTSEYDLGKNHGIKRCMVLLQEVLRNQEFLKNQEM